MDGFQQPAPEKGTVEISAPRPARRVRLRFVVLALAALVIAAAGGFYGHRWWTTGRFLEETDDAYTQADAVTVAPRVGGTISEVLVSDNQLVRAGQVLARIDDRDYRAVPCGRRGRRRRRPRATSAISTHRSRSSKRRSPRPERRSPRRRRRSTSPAPTLPATWS